MKALVKHSTPREDNETVQTHPIRSFAFAMSSAARPMELYARETTAK